jgi:hypothetical protein
MGWALIRDMQAPVGDTTCRGGEIGDGGHNKPVGDGKPNCGLEAIIEHLGNHNRLEALWAKTNDKCGQPNRLETTNGGRKPCELEATNEGALVQEACGALTWEATNGGRKPPMGGRKWRRATNGALAAGLLRGRGSHQWE